MLTAVYYDHAFGDVDSIDSKVAGLVKYRRQGCRTCKV